MMEATKDQMGLWTEDYCLAGSEREVNWSGWYQKGWLMVRSKSRCRGQDRDGYARHEGTELAQKVR